MFFFLIEERFVVFSERYVNLKVKIGGNDDKKKFIEFFFNLVEKNDSGLFIEDILIQLKCWMMVESILV